MKRSMQILAAMIIITSSPAYGDDNAERYFIGLEFFMGDTLTSDPKASSGCYHSLGSECRGVFYVADQSFGVFGGLKTQEIQNLSFEMPYVISLVEEDDRVMLHGRIYAMNLNDHGDIIGGHRFAFLEDITWIDQLSSNSRTRLGRDFTVEAGKLIDGTPITVRISAFSEKPNVPFEMGDAKLALITTQIVDGEKFSAVRNWVSNFSDTVNIRTGFGLPAKVTSEGSPRQMKYEVEIIFAPASGRTTTSGLRELLFTRTYFIDTNYVSSVGFDTNLVYTSQYRKPVDLRFGSQIQIIFPPDTPSVHGFNIEDTLILVPN